MSRRETQEKRTSSEGHRSRTVRVRPPRSWMFVAGVLSVLLFAYLSHGLVRNYQELMQVNAEIEQVQEEIDEERLLQDSLQQRIELLEDPRYIEIRAREELGLIRPGDVPIRWGRTPGH